MKAIERRIILKPVPYRICNPKIKNSIVLSFWDMATREYLMTTNILDQIKTEYPKNEENRTNTPTH